MSCEKRVDAVRTFNFRCIKCIYLILFVLFSSVTEERHKDPQPDVVLTSSASQYQHVPSSFVPGMDDAEFRRCGKEMVDYIADYLLHIR